MLEPDSLANHDLRCTCVSQSRIASVSYECGVWPVLQAPVLYLGKCCCCCWRKVYGPCCSSLSLWELLKCWLWLKVGKASKLYLSYFPTRKYFLTLRGTRIQFVYLCLWKSLVCVFFFKSVSEISLHNVANDKVWRNMTFMWPCIVINSYNKTKYMH